MYFGSNSLLRRSADAAILLVNYHRTSCGVASFQSNPRRGENVGWIQKHCGLGYYTLGHELGHMFGAGHNREEGRNPWYWYGYGWYVPGSRTRSIMAYPRKDGYTTYKANFFSMDYKQYGSFYHDNAYVIKRNAYNMASASDESGNC